MLRVDDWQVQRLKLNRDVRSILVSANINTERMSVNVYPDRIYFRGTLETNGAGASLDPIMVSNLFQEIKRVRGVKQISCQFENWENDGDLLTWREIGGDPKKKKKTKATPSGDGGTYEVN